MQNPEATASDLVNQLGPKAPQHVVDQIVVAIRANDIATAKQWELVGAEVDAYIAENPSEPQPLNLR